MIAARPCRVARATRHPACVWICSQLHICPAARRGDVPGRGTGEPSCGSVTDAGPASRPVLLGQRDAANSAEADAAGTDDVAASREWTKRGDEDRRAPERRSSSRPGCAVISHEPHRLGLELPRSRARDLESRALVELEIRGARAICSRT